jgi:hypothetical protein
MNLLGRFLRLPRYDQVLLLRAASLIIFTRIGLRLSNVQTMGRLLGGHNKHFSQARRMDEKHSVRIIWAVEVTGHYLLVDKRCLTQALVAQRLLREARDPSTLRIGFCRIANGQVDAHAWLEDQGKVLIGYLDDLDEYVPVPSLSYLAE